MNTALQVPPRPSEPGPPEPRRLGPLAGSGVGVGLLVIGLFVLGAGTWSASAPISAAAIANGEIKVIGNRRTVQHLEGGIIRELLVREGQLVKAGQVLVRLDEIQSSSNQDLLKSQLDALRALDARLSAEDKGAEAIAFPADLTARKDDARIALSLAGQQQIFASRRRATQDSIAVLDQRVSQTKSELRGHEAQLVAAEEQYALLREEITSVRKLITLGAESQKNLLVLLRQQAAVMGAREDRMAQIERAKSAIREAEVQVARIRSEFKRDVLLEQRETQTKIAEIEEKVRAAADVQARREIAAPMDGYVVNLRFFTVGGVVRAGDPILDLVPKDEELVVEVEVNPVDIDVVGVGMEAEVRFSAFRQRVMPIVLGSVTHVSADIFKNERTGASFYRARVTVSPEQRKLLGEVQIQPGMPAEVLILSGARTMLGYLWSPIRDSFRRAFREQ
jgi:HlyD family type I secretion membrane fusion protein